MSTDKYDGLLGLKAPRYTSYPCALHFTQVSGDQHAEWITEFESEQDLALYIHIPFCKQLCWFCGCHTQITQDYETIRLYCRSLCDEMAMIAQCRNEKLKVHTIHFGGGSPSLLNVEDLSGILATVYALFDVNTDAEIAIEADPRTLNDLKIDAYKCLGLNRISLGVQDLNEKVQTTIHRKLADKELQHCCDRLHAVGLDNINFDLIYGLPYQTLDSLKTTIEQVSQHAPQRISLYSFAHLPHFKKHHKILEPNTFPNERLKWDMYLQASIWLQAEEYTPLGIDHFVKSNDNLLLAYQNRKLKRNFMGYTPYTNDYVLGIGISAVSHLPQGFSQNSVTRPLYLHAIKSHRFATERGWIDTKDDKLRRFIIQELMCYFTVDIPKTLEKFGYDQNYLDHEMNLMQTWVAKKIIQIEDGKIIFISALKMLVRAICAVFDRYHVQTEQQHYSNVS